MRDALKRSESANRRLTWRATPGNLSTSSQTWDNYEADPAVYTTAEAALAKT